MAGSNTSLANASSPVHQPQAQGSPRWPSLLTSRLRPSSPPLLLSACCLGRAGRSEPHGVQWGGPSFLWDHHPGRWTGGFALYKQLSLRNLLRCLINAPLTLEVIFSIRCPKISLLRTNGKMWSQHLIILGYFQLYFDGKISYSLH